MTHGLLSILTIDDDAGDRSLCQRALKSAWNERLRFMEADSGEDGLGSIEKHIPDCVLLDHSLPGISGVEVLKRIRLKYPYLPVVMIDGWGNDVIAVQSMKEGAQDYIVKSTITPSILQRAIQVAVEHCAMEKRIEEQRTSLEIFTRALAHDLKEPVRTIRSFLDKITDSRTLSERSQQSFDYIRKAADRMGALIDAVYLYTRLDASEQMEMTACNIADVLEAVQENLAQLIEERGAAITCGALPSVHANRVQMIQLVQNLVTNAIRHCVTPVSIHVSAEEREHHWRLTVRDNGPGIEKEHFKRIFDPFSRFSQCEGGEPGLGLGLAISRKAAEAHGGKLWCESEFGAGSSFIFTLLKVTAPTVAESCASTSIASVKVKAAGAIGALVRVLLVDDNKGDIELNRIMLVEDARLDCEVLTASDGRDALALLRDAAQRGSPFDLVLLDINMPIMNGFELLTQMKKEVALLHAVVVMCTTSGSDMDQGKAKSLGAAGFLTKPSDFSLLKAVIDNCGHLRLSQEDDDWVLRRVA